MAEMKIGKQLDLTIHCDFETRRFRHPHWKFTHLCKRCKVRRYSRTRSYIRICEKAVKKCEHLEPEVKRLTDCFDCQGVKLKVLGCRIFGECLPGPKKVDGIASCQTCEHHTSRTKSK